MAQRRNAATSPGVGELLADFHRQYSDGGEVMQLGVGGPSVMIFRWEISRNLALGMVESL